MKRLGVRLSVYIWCADSAMALKMSMANIRANVAGYRLSVRSPFRVEFG